MKTSEHIERLARGIRFRPNKNTDERILAAAEAALGKKTFPDIEPEKMRLIIMRNPIIRIAAAAAIVAVCLISVSLWTGTQSGIALADVLARVEQVKAVKYKETFKVFGEDPNKPWADDHCTWLTSKEYGAKTLSLKRDPNGEERTEAEMYRLRQNKPIIGINYMQKTYRRQVRAGQTQNEQSQDRTDQAEDPLSYLKEILRTEHESIGRSIIDGTEVAGFRTADPNYKYKGPRFLHIKEEQQADVKLWVSVKTLLPVRIEYLTSALDQTGTRVFLQQVDYDFQWDVPVDASEFEAPPIPDGYAIQDTFPELANEENSIGGLKRCIELLGNYPERIDLTYLWAESEKSETTAALRLKEELKGLTGLERDNKKMDALKPMRFLSKFYRGLASKDPAYYGKTVTPKDADKVLMRWKLSNNEYRVIYGDLHTETVSKKKLVELEKTLPK